VAQLSSPWASFPSPGKWVADRADPKPLWGGKEVGEPPSFLLCSPADFDFKLYYCCFWKEKWKEEQNNFVFGKKKSFFNIIRFVKPSSFALCCM